MNDLFDLERFVEAQQPVYARVVSELRNGQKTSHWMWFVFPQIAGLGGSPMAIRYAIGSLAEARAYLEHPVLGPRLSECCEILEGLEGRTAEAIFGYPDVLKLRSSLTLFSRATGKGDSVFDALLANYYEGKPDPQTLALIA